MAVNSNVKGKRGEREAVSYLKSLGFVDARRTQQYRGGQQSADVECPESLPALHVEVKSAKQVEGQKLDLGCEGLMAACAQAERDADGKPWVVLWRPTGMRQWRLTCDVFGYRITLARDKDIATFLESSGVECGFMVIRETEGD